MLHSLLVSSKRSQQSKHMEWKSLLRETEEKLMSVSHLLIESCPPPLCQCIRASMKTTQPTVVSSRMNKEVKIQFEDLEIWYIIQQRFLFWPRILVLGGAELFVFCVGDIQWQLQLHAGVDGFMPSSSFNALQPCLAPTKLSFAKQPKLLPKNLILKRMF